MWNNATFVTKQQLKLLKEMDNWLANEPWQSEVELNTALQVRELITKIEKQGYYYELFPKGKFELEDFQKSAVGLANFLMAN